MSKINELAAYLFITENKEDVNAEIVNNEEFYGRAEKLLKVSECIKVHFQNELKIRPDHIFFEKEYTTIIYDLGKEVYGENKANLKLYFQDIYLLMFGVKAGPRLSTFISMVGHERFCEILINKINSPFGFAD